MVYRSPVEIGLGLPLALFFLCDKLPPHHEDAEGEFPFDIARQYTIDPQSLTPAMLTRRYRWSEGVLDLDGQTPGGRQL